MTNGTGQKVGNQKYCDVRGGRCNSYGARGVLGVLLSIGLVVSILSPAIAAPWWWVTFSAGNGVTNNSSNVERYISQFAYSAATTDKVYVASFSWGTGTNDVINGTWGINNMFSQRSGAPGAGPIRVIADIDDLADINATKSPAIPMIAGAAGSSDAHNKVITLGTTAVMTGSMNFTNGAYAAQTNNMLIIRVPSVAQAYVTELDDMFNNGAFVENTKSPQNLFSAPNGDRIEVFFAPDDNGNISLSPYSANSALKDVIKYHITNSTESVFYMINQFGMGSELSSALTGAAGSKLVEGWVDVDIFSNLGTLQASHTARSWSAKFNVQGHHKVMVFDMDKVAFGSANHTYAAMRDSSGSANCENLVVVYDFRLARKYMWEYRRSMALLTSESVGGPDSFDNTAPGAVSNLIASDVAGTSNQIQVSWTGPVASDLSRYYAFISASPISQATVGDGIDNDGDGYVDEDPAGDADGFSSGSGSLTANNDDADGQSDEDQWMYPEVQAKSQVSGGNVSAIISTVNAGDVLQDNITYYIGVVAVDKHGNEGAITVTTGQSLPAQPGAKPAASVAFDTPVPADVINTPSVLALSVGNDAAGARPITTVVVNLDTLATSETASASQTAPTNWSVTVSGNVLTYTTASVPDYIDPAETLVFKISVTNSANTGPCAPIFVAATDNNNVTISGLNAGFVTLQPTPPSLQPPPPPPAQNKVSTISAQDANANTATLLNGSENLLQTDITVTYTCATAPNTGTSLWWDVNKDPDGPGGSTTDRQVTSSGGGTNFSAVIPGSTDPGVVHNAQIRFLAQIDNVLDTNNMNFFKFNIDDSVTLPGGLSVVTPGFNDLTIGWNVIADTDFLQYDIFYSNSSPVTLASPSLTITSRTQTSVQITGLSLATTYYVAIQSKDAKGNVSGLSPQLTAATNIGTNVSVTNATDGTVVITQFNATGTLTDNAITVSFILDKVPAKASDVQIWFDVGDNPDGPGGFNSTDRQVFAAGSGAQWQAVIPGTDAEIVGGALVKFVFVIAGQVITNTGVPYLFKVVQGIATAPSNFQITDTLGTGFTVTWSALNVPSNFSSYRIFYATDTATTSSPSWDRDDDLALYFSSANRTTITAMAPNTQYKMRVAGVDGLGNVGPLSSQQVGTTGSRGAVLITEVAIQESPEFVELEAVTGPVDISAFSITDLDVAPVALAGSALTLQKGGRAVVWLAAGTDETDGVGDANGNGYRDIYVTPGPSLAATTDEVVLLAANGDTVDAVVYRGTKLDNIDATDLAALTPTHWTGTDSSGAVRAFTSVAYQRTPSIARKKIASGTKLSDDNARTDWQVVTDTTAGTSNQFATISSVTVSDTSNAGTVRTATELSGLDKLKGGPYRLKATLSQIPVVSGGLKFWYDTDNTPDGRSSGVPTDAPITILMAAGARTVDTDVAIPEAKNLREIRFIFSSENDATNPDIQDEILLTRGGLPYQFTVDQSGPDTPTGLKVIDKTLGGLKLTWTPIANPGDFANYVLLYDTGVVTISSKSWSGKDDPGLGNVGASSTQITGLTSNVNYRFRLAAVDLLGNLSGLSDTASETTVAPVKANFVTATDGVSTIENFSGSARLRQVSPTISVTFDRSVTNPVLYWNTILPAPADGPGGNSDSTVSMTAVTSNQFSCTLPVLSNDSTVFFVFNTDAGVIRNGSAAFSYRVDGVAGDSVPRFKFGGYFDVGPNRNTSVAVTWAPLSAASYPDFLEYRILYQKGDTVTVATASAWGSAKAPILKDIRASGTAIQNLAPNETYSMAVYWLDQTGNQALISDTFRVATINAVPFVDPATDGLNIAHALDGTEWLMKTDITVTFEFSASPMDVSGVVLKWNAGAAAGAEGSRTIPMTARAWNPLVYDGVIPGSTDPLITDGCMVQYALWGDGIKFDNNGVDFKFKIDANPPVPLLGVNLIDNGSSLTSVWSPVSMSDFSTYRIRYRPSTTGTWSTLDRWNKSILGNVSASNLTFSVSATGHYYVNVATVDFAGHEAWQATDRIIKRGAALDPMVTALTPRLMPVVAGKPVTLTAKLLDMNGAGWADQTVNFILKSDTGGLGSPGIMAKTALTGPDGKVSMTLLPTESQKDYMVRVTSPSTSAVAWFYLYALADERLKDQTHIIYYGND